MDLTDYPKRYCPACNSLVEKEFGPGPGFRPDASCPSCGSLERHRFLALLLACLQPTLGTLSFLLDVAPTPPVTPLLRRLGADRMVRFDIGADNREVDLIGSLTDVPLADDSVDLLMCYHVLEHIPDDRAAMREIARVLRPGGLAILQVPWRPGAQTDEDPQAPPEERITRFGQIDHVRYYGADFEDRLTSSGLALTRVTPESLFGRQMCTWFKLVPNETVWLATPSSASAPAVPATATATSLTLSLDALAAQLMSQRRRGDAAQKKVASLQARIAALRERDVLVRLARLAPQRVRRSDSRIARAVRRRVTV